MMLEDALAEGINLALQDVLPAHPACRKIKTTQTAEEGNMTHL